MSWLPFCHQFNFHLAQPFHPVFQKLVPGELFNSKLRLPSAEEIAEAKAQQKSDAASWWQWHGRMHQVLVLLSMHSVSHALFGCPRVHSSMDMQHPFKSLEMIKNLGLTFVDAGGVEAFVCSVRLLQPSGKAATSWG